MKIYIVPYTLTIKLNYHPTKSDIL